MIVSLNIPTNYHILPFELSGIEKFKMIVRGEGKYLVELIWQGRDVSIEVHLKNKQLSHNKAEELIMDNLSNLFANLVYSQEWHPAEGKVTLIWNEHMNEFALYNESAKTYVYKKVDKEMKEKFKKELKIMEKEKSKMEKGASSPRVAPRYHIHEEVDQRIIRIRMALELDAKKLVAKRNSAGSLIKRSPRSVEAARRASVI